MKLLITASGGDAPGINNFLWYIQSSCPDDEIYYSEYGLQGISKNKFKKLKEKDSKYLYDLPTSFIKCGRFPEFKDDLSKREETIKNIKQFNYLIILGGDGTQKAAKIISTHNINTIFVPLTVDNDVKETDETLGFHTSLRDIVHNVNNISYTIEAHGYVGLVEIMGRGCSDLTTYTAEFSRANLATHVDNLLTPKEFAKEVSKFYKKQGHCIGVVMEKMKYSIDDYKVEIDKLGLKCRNTSLGHTQRGGVTSIGDIRLASEFAKGVKNILGKNISGTVATKKGVVKLYEFK